MFEHVPYIACVFFCILVWFITYSDQHGKLSDFKQKSEADVSVLKEQIKKIENENEEIKKQLFEDFKSSINYVSDSYSKAHNLATEQVCFLISKGSEYKKITDCNSLFGCDIEELVKTGKYAEKGLLDLYQDLESDDGRLFIVGNGGEKYYPEEADIERMENGDFSFVFSQIRID